VSATFTLPVASELDDLHDEYLAAQAAVVDAVEAAANAIEEAADLRVRYVALHAYELKQGTEVPPRVMRGTLPGGTSPTGLRERWLQASGSAW